MWAGLTTRRRRSPMPTRRATWGTTGAPFIAPRGNSTWKTFRYVFKEAVEAGVCLRDWLAIATGVSSY